ncbi:MAG TPA: exosortase-associated EpsI family protein [Pirellulales bacterium]|nr:exosortase-associated EpsI family protein [Pirellulales bacterium]
MELLANYWSFIIPAVVCLGLLVVHFYVQGTGKLLIRLAIVSIVLLAAHSYLQGKWTERWNHRSVSEEQKLYAERLNHVPTSFGNWDSVDSPIDERSKEASGAVNTFSRRYVNRTDPDKAVEIYIVCGHPKDITQHTPDQCYVLSGFEEAEDEQSYTIDSGENGKTSADFTTTRFRKGLSFNPQDLRIFWSFGHDGKWEAPRVPKYSLMHYPALYKIYANTDLHGSTHISPVDSAAVPFLREFMPILNSVLFPPDEKSGNSAAPSESAASNGEAQTTPAAAQTAPAAEAHSSPPAADDEKPSGK